MVINYNWDTSISLHLLYSEGWSGPSWERWAPPPCTKEITRKQHYRVSAGPAPIHSVLLQRSPSPKWWPDPCPRTRLKAECEAAAHCNLTQRPFYGNPTSSRCVACARTWHQLDLCRVLGLSEDFGSKGWPTTCCARYGVHLIGRLILSPSGAFRMLLETAPLRFSELQGASTVGHVYRTL